ncbi:MAG: HNH endonuclease signature motif containing protein [Chloroflexi bacterium]|nr:HNH endonuclease signature motif containing protein [Chloroflexota bacterium]
MDDTHREREDARRLRRNAEGQGRYQASKSYTRVLARQGNLCVYCLCDIRQGSLKGSELDHITPIARGGSHDVDNLQVICSLDNRSKGAMLHDEYLEAKRSMHHAMNLRDVEAWLGGFASYEFERWATMQARTQADRTVAEMEDDFAAIHHKHAFFDTLDSYSHFEPLWDHVDKGIFIHNVSSRQGFLETVDCNCDSLPSSAVLRR